MRNLEPDINTKYIVEEVEIRGVPDREITPEMRADLQALTGKPLDSDVAERLETRLKSTFTNYNVERRTSRGSQPGQIKVVFQLTRTEESRWLRFEPMEANALYHSDQGWGAKMPLTMSGGDFLVLPHFALDVGDDLIEEYSGFGVRFESRKLGTERLGVSFEWSTFDQTWRDPTLAALAASSASAGALSQPHDGDAAREVRDHAAAHAWAAASALPSWMRSTSPRPIRRWRTPRSAR